jgi:signal transduction histidine kinase
MPLVRDKRVKLEKDVPVELAHVQGDRMRVKQVLLNLISNAIKFTHAGRVLVQVRPEGEAVHVSVADTGIGISPDEMKHVFQPFYTTKADGKGTGLGLSVSQGIVRRHEGTLEVTSEPGKGSTFMVSLPLAP